MDDLTVMPPNTPPTELPHSALSHLVECFPRGLQLRRGKAWLHNCHVWMAGVSLGVHGAESGPELGFKEKESSSIFANRI